MDDTFAIDRFSGRIVLKRSLDYETRQEYGLKISASDTAHIAYTTLSIRVTDVNDNPPLFHQPAYHISLPGELIWLSLIKSTASNNIVFQIKFPTTTWNC